MRRHAQDRTGGPMTAFSGPVVRIASFDRQAAQIVAGHARSLAEGRDRALARAYAFGVERIVADDVPAARAVARRLPEVIAVADDSAALALIEAVVAGAQQAPAAAVCIVEHGAGLLERVPLPGLRAYIDEGLRLWARDPVAGQAFLAGTSMAARDRLAAALGLDLESQRGRLTDYGRTFGVQVEVHAGQGTWPAELDGCALAVPTPLRVFGDDRDVDVARVVVARAAARLVTPPQRAGLSETEADLLDLLETRRADAALRRRLPGLAAAMDRVGRAPVSRDQALSRQPVPMQVRRLLAAHCLGLTPPPAASAAARGTYQALVDELVLLDAPGATVDMSARLARQLAEVLDPDGVVGVRVAQPGEIRLVDLRRPAPPIAPEATPQPEPEPSMDPEARPEGEGAGASGDEAGTDEADPESTAGADGQADPTADGEAAPGGGDATDGTEQDVGAAPVGAHSPDEVEAEPVPPAAQERAEVVATYPEWDPALRELRRDWAEVHENPVTSRDRGFAERTLQSRAATIRELRRVFLALRTEGARPARRRIDGPELDLDAAVDRSVERRAGRLSDGRLYQRPHERGRDVAVALLVDLSSSTREVLPDGMRIVDVEKEAVLCLGEALVAAGDRFAVMGFSGHGRDDVQVSVAKDFSEPWDPRTRAGVGGLRPLLENRDGAAIRHATARLLAQDARTRLLVLLSDGRPLDCGDPNYHGEYARADTADALRSARAAGVRPLCLTVAQEGTDAFDRLYGRGAYVIVRDPAKLAKEVGHHYAAWCGR